MSLPSPLLDKPLPLVDGPGTAEWPVWTTTARVVVTDPETLPEVRALVVEHLALVDAVASRFRADSEVRWLAASTSPTNQISPLLADLVAVALRAAAQTSGAVDPTVGNALVDLGYGGDLEPPHPPGRTGSVRLRRRISWRDVQLDGRLLAMPPGTLLDLGATGKAHAADHCAVTAARRFRCGVLVSLGGDLRVAGEAPGGGWEVLVQDGPDEPASRIRLRGAEAVATSSTLHRRWRRGRRVLHHVLDPVSRQPAEPVWRTVTVAADTCLWANTLTTASLVAGRDAPALFRHAGVAARLVARDGTVLRLGGWPA